MPLPALIERAAFRSLLTFDDAPTGSRWIEAMAAEEGESTWRGGNPEGTLRVAKLWRSSRPEPEGVRFEVAWEGE